MCLILDTGPLPQITNRSEYGRNWDYSTRFLPPRLGWGSMLYHTNNPPTKEIIVSTSFRRSNCISSDTTFSFYPFFAFFLFSLFGGLSWCLECLLFTFVIVMSHISIWAISTGAGYQDHCLLTLRCFRRRKKKTKKKGVMMFRHGFGVSVSLATFLASSWIMSSLRWSDCNGNEEQDFSQPRPSAVVSTLLHPPFSFSLLSPHLREQCLYYLVVSMLSPWYHSVYFRCILLWGEGLLIPDGRSLLNMYINMHTYMPLRPRWLQQIIPVSCSMKVYSPIIIILNDADPDA